MNTHLSHPEQVKRWAVLTNDLSIQDGDMTANLKLKREVITQKRSDIIKVLYSEGELPKDILHLGRVEEENE
jgi:long-chain acyl-CoA synthetase